MPQYTETKITVLAAGGEILPYSAKRKGIIFPGPAANRYTLTKTATPVLDVGYNQYPSASPLQFWGSEVGQMVQAAWFGISAVADQTIVIGEVFE